MADVSNRIKIIFQNPRKKPKEDEPEMIAVTFDWLFENGVPLTQKGKPWKYHSVELVQ